MHCCSHDHFVYNDENGRVLLLQWWRAYRRLILIDSRAALLISDNKCIPGPAPLQSNTMLYSSSKPTRSLSAAVQFSRQSTTSTIEGSMILGWKGEPSKINYLTKIDNYILKSTEWLFLNDICNCYVLTPSEPPVVVLVEEEDIYLTQIDK